MSGAKYLTQKAAEEGVITLKSGMLVEILKTGSNSAAKSPKVTALYHFLEHKII